LTSSGKVRLWHLPATALGAFLGVYLVVRGVAEFFILVYSDPASYRHDWGGPSLLGVLAVHSGPAIVVLGGAAVLLVRRAREQR